MDDAYKSMFVSKTGLLDKFAKFQATALTQTSYEYKALKKELVDMLLRYVYYKTTWFADMKTEFNVEISGKCHSLAS